MRFGVSTPVTNPPVTGFQPIALLLQSTSLERLDADRQRLAELDRADLINLFGRAFAEGKRLAAFLASDELTARGVPPVFRHSYLSNATYSLNQRFDLLTADLRWLRRCYPAHAKIVRYQRYKSLLAGSDSLFHREAEYTFYQGKRPLWRIVASLRMTEHQQWDCVLLQSASIKKRCEFTVDIRDKVFTALQNNLQIVRRTKSFTAEDANVALLRRHALWVCSRMTKNRSPTEVAARYVQMTGRQITRQVAAKQLENIREILHKNEMTF